MKKHLSFIVTALLLSAFMLSGCAKLQFKYFGTDSKTLLKDIAKATDEKVSDFTFYDKTDDGPFVYLTRVDNVYITVYASDSYNKLQIALAFTDLTDETIETFGLVCGSVIKTIDPLADTDTLITGLGMDAYTLNVTNTYESDTIQYQYTTTSSAIYFTMYKD
ncbi:hypothetical protein SDC9_193764 [bioreactor metagenome]|uniref:Lipoprotein n=1 Tax=bioreactor metagenome TaxID=1076179 RepID=A0A645I4G1_9ZZZZ